MVILLFVIGIVVLIAEIFLPSFGILTVAGLAFLLTAIYKAYGVSAAWGHGSVITTMVVLPTLAIVAVRTFHRTPWGKRMAPANPIARSEEFAPQHEELKRYVGRAGKTLTSLRPVGTCLVDGDRVNSVAESGLIEANIEVEVVGIRGRELAVRIRKKMEKTA